MKSNNNALCYIGGLGNKGGLEEDNLEEYNLEKGTVTAELATTLPAVMALLAVVIALAAAFGTQFRVSDAARTGARLAAIGAEYVAIRSSIIGIVGGNPAIEISRDEDWATVQVRQSIRVGPLWLGPLTVSASATAWLEP